MISDEFDTYDLYMNHDGFKIHDLMKFYFIDKTMKSSDVLENTLDEIIAHNQDIFSEYFDEQFSEYIEKSINYVWQVDDGRSYHRALGV